MTPLRARLHRIETVDVAGLLGGALNAILRAAEGGDADGGGRQTQWWELALGGAVDELAVRIDTLRGAEAYRSALLPFAAAQQWRAASLGYLHLAIEAGAERSYRRWRWSARAYLGAVDRFGNDQALRARVEAARRGLDADAAGASLRRNPVHASHFSALRERFTAGAERTGVEQQHAAERARDLLSAIARREQQRADLLQRRDALRREARKASVGDDLAVGASSLEEEVRAYERALRDRDSAAARAHAAIAAEGLAAELRKAFAAHSSDVFAGYEGEPPLLLRLAGALPSTSGSAQHKGGDRVRDDTDSYES